MIFQVGRACRFEQYVMMEEQQLRAYPLFRRLGAFSVVRKRPREAARSIEYAGRLLRNTDRVLWIFPQGETLPNDQRPLHLYAGAAHIIKQTGVAYAAPIALRYEFLDDFRPEALMRIGAPARIEVKPKFNTQQLTNGFRDALTCALDKVRSDVLRANFADYEELVAAHRRK